MSGILAEKLIPAKNGYSVCIGEIKLHSVYNPMLEAEKFIASLELKETYRYFILIEPGLGYLASALEKQYPFSNVLILHCSAFFSGENLYSSHPEITQNTAPNWNPLCAESLEDFLDSHIASADAAEIRLIEWKPSVNAYGRNCAELAQRTVEYIRRVSAGKKTVRQFGRRWLKNALKNLTLFGNPVEYGAGDDPVLVCAAGPGLEDSLPAIAAWKQSARPPLLIAVSSAVNALLFRNIIPDIIVTTDGGPWALFHLFESIRAFNTTGKKPVLAAALSAALPSQAEDWPILILSDGSLWQEFLLRSCNLPFARFPQRGTVSATALDLALFLSGASAVYLAGLDFSHRDIKTHARPYAFEALLETSSSRYKPFYSLVFERERSIHNSGSLGIYETWFKTHIQSLSDRLFTLTPSALNIPTATPLRECTLPLKDNAVSAAKEKAAYCVKKTVPPDRAKNIKLLQEVLANPLTAQQAEKELGELLSTDTVHKKGAVSAIIEKELRGFTVG
jgi:hypothetical protein